MEVIQVATEPARHVELDAPRPKPRPLLLDALPEHYTYRDDGCDVSPSCLRCPLPQCKHDEPGWYQRMQRVQRDRTISRLRRREGLSVTQLARRFGVSKRTVFRALHRAKDGIPSPAANGAGRLAG